jgi:hypothetical protein
LFELLSVASRFPTEAYYLNKSGGELKQSAYYVKINEEKH